MPDLALAFIPEPERSPERLAAAQTLVEDLHSDDRLTLLLDLLADLPLDVDDRLDRVLTGVADHLDEGQAAHLLDGSFALIQHPDPTEAP